MTDEFIDRQGAVMASKSRETENCPFLLGAVALLSDFSSRGSARGQEGVIVETLDDGKALLALRIGPRAA